jgi:hypothetical protein
MVMHRGNALRVLAQQFSRESNCLKKEMLVSAQWNLGDCDRAHCVHLLFGMYGRSRVARVALPVGTGYCCR